MEIETVFDIESDGLLDTITKIHVLSWSDDDGKTVHSTHDYQEMRDFFNSDRTFVGHYITMFDLKAVEMILGVKVNARVIDTVAVSWAINHTRISHGLESYGEDFGIPKPKVNDWENLSPEEYLHRCEEDVKINCRLWRNLKVKLLKLYNKDASEVDRYVDYLTFKMKCAVDQRDEGWRLDVGKTQDLCEELTQLKEEKTKALSEAMPRKVILKEVKRPKVMYRKDGELSAHGQRFEDLRKENMQAEDVQSFMVKSGEELGNPNSVPQVKDWLFSLGWVPRTFKFTRNKVTGEEKNTAQVRNGEDLCDSVLDLVDNDKAVALLDGLTVLTHRLGIVKAFLSSHKGGYLEANISGFTNTLRFKHSKPLVNLPSVEKPWGAEIRGCLIAPSPDTELCGSDMVSLEDTTKRHFMQPHDPDYVAEMSVEGYDPHLSLAVFAKDITMEQYRDYQYIDKQLSEGKTVDLDQLSFYKSLKGIRKNFKVTNYSATYGIGKVALARASGMTTTKAGLLLEAYWKKNWSLNKIASGLRVKSLFGGMWVLNPVSGFWYSLRYEKDRFSTLNQGTGVYCFDMWVKEVKERGIRLCGQFHDEIIAISEKGNRDKTEVILKEAINTVNHRLNLNVKLSVDVQFGDSYADIH